MEPYRVFVSSIMNRSTEDLLAEREAACAAVEHFAPITTPWAFEAEPASPKPLLDFYIDAVKTSDVFILIVGQHLTKPVDDEFNAARDHNKPVLAFSKSLPSRDPGVEALLRSLNAKYDPFANAVELRDKVRKSLGRHVLSLIRGEGGESVRPGDRLARLRSYARNNTHVKILPLLPAYQYNSFRVTDVGTGTVTFHKDSNLQDVHVPAQRIEDVLEAGPRELPTVLVNGRLQWLTISEVWKFFSEKPALGDRTGIGFGKLSRLNDVELTQKLGGRALRWFVTPDAPLLFRDGWEIFYDDDGSYLTAGPAILFIGPSAG